MLKWLRKSTRSWLVYLAIGAIVMVFIFWGVGSYRASSSQTAAVVNGTSIPFTAYMRHYNNLAKQYQERTGGELTQEMVKNLRLKESALNQLIEEALILQAGERLGCRLTDAELRRDIQNYPAFQKDGKFDEKRYYWILSRSRVSPQEFEAQERQRLLFRRVVDEVSSLAKVSDLEVQEFFRLGNEAVAVNYLVVKPDRFLTQENPSEVETSRYYQEHQEDFRVPERARVNYLVFPIKDFLSQVKPTAAEVQDYLKEHNEEFIRPRVIRVRQLLLAVPSQATVAQRRQVAQQVQDLVNRLKRGEDFAQLAQNFSQDEASKNQGGDLGDVTRGQNLPDWDQVAFGLKPGTIGVAATAKGFYLIKLEEIKETEKTPDAEKQVEERLRQEKARNLAKEAAEQARQELSRGTPLAQVAQKLGLKPQEAPWLALGDAVPGLGVQPNFNRTALNLQPRGVSPVVDLASGFAILQGVEHQAEHLPLLDGCKDQVRLAVKKRGAAKKAEQEAARILADLRQGKALAQVATAAAVPVQDSGFFTRFQGFLNQRQAEGLTSAAFGLSPQHPYPEKPLVWEDNYYLLAYKARKEPDPGEFEKERDNLAMALLDQKRQMIFVSWLNQERQRAKIKISTLP